MQGWFKLYRGWMDSGVFARENYTEREAWLWLIENAAICNRTINIKNQPYELERGELSYSIRYLATQWGWHRNRVKRYLDRLEKWSMIRAQTGTAAGQGQTVISICNYSKFQDGWDSPVQESGQQRDRSGTNNKKVKEGKKNKNIYYYKPNGLNNISPFDEVYSENKQEISDQETLPDKQGESELVKAVRLYNELADELGLHKVQRLTRKREPALRMRLKEAGGIEGWILALDKIRASPFLQGDNDRGWRASLDFLIQESSFTKLMENFYEKSYKSKHPF